VNERMVRTSGATPGESASSALAARVASAAAEAGLSVGTAESLTSGAVASALGAAPDASSWFRGAVVAYASEVKFELLGVRRGPVVTEDAALAMARGAARRLGADLVVSVTGAGGPDPQDGRAPGTVCFGLVHPGGELSQEHHFPGDPEEVVRASTEHALELLAATAEERASRQPTG